MFMGVPWETVHGSLELSAVSIQTHQSLLKAVLTSQQGSRWGQEDGKCPALLIFLIGKYFLSNSCRKTVLPTQRWQVLAGSSGSWSSWSWRDLSRYVWCLDIVHGWNATSLIWFNISSMALLNFGLLASCLHRGWFFCEKWVPFPPYCPLFLGLLSNTFCVRAFPLWIFWNPSTPRASHIYFYCGIVRDVPDVCFLSLSVSDPCQAKCWAH